ncbi:MAG TPA: NAD(P)/FAD-dependent oxidoreductase [Anaerolineaceae bacterium]|nr:NAD(P)/FAD-dependent oxidoreductase [Anaerolineaceae bacterium]
MSRAQVDVLVIGGGPAGLASGICAANLGLRTVIVERQAYPVDKACGEGIMPTGVELLKSLGVADHLQADEIYPFKGVQYISREGRQARGEFQEAPGWGVRRTALSRAMLARARQLDCLEIRSGETLDHLERYPEQIVAHLSDGTVETRLLVGADGLHSRVRRWAALDRGSSDRRRWGARQHFAMPPWSQDVEVWWGQGLEAYITPCGENCVGIALLWDRQKVAPPGGRSLFPALIRRFPELSRRLAGIPPASDVRAAGPLAQPTRGVAAAGLVLVGDAAGYLDAITGDGISLGLAGAFALQQNVFPLLHSRPDHAPLISPEELDGYAQAMRRIYAPYLHMTRMVLTIGRSETLTEAAIAFLARRPLLFQQLLSANLGTASLWPGINRILQG